MKIIVLCEEIIDNFGNVTGIEIIDEHLSSNTDQSNIFDKYKGKTIKMVQVDLDLLLMPNESIIEFSREIQDAVHREYSKLLNSWLLKQLLDSDYLIWRDFTTKNEGLLGGILLQK